MRSSLILIFLIISNLSLIYAENSSADSLESKEKYLIILPFGFYTSDTSVALGLFSQYKFNEKNKIFGNVIYTFKNQLMLFLITDIYSGNSIIYNKFKIENYYSESYGIGIGSETEGKYDYRYILVDNLTEAGKFIRKNTSLSIVSDNFYYKPNDSKDILANAYSPENDQYANGIGASVKYSDVSDKFFRDGSFSRLSFIYFPEFLGDLKEFSVLSSESGYYRSFNQSALNLNFLTRFAFGSPHPQKLSYIGGSEILRGYPEKRFIDRNMWALQSQYDFRLYKKLALCAFVSAGSVFDGYDDISMKNVKAGYGGGLIYEYRGLVLRIEAATSAEKDIQIIATGARAF
ncbi:MAG: hypothetical protein PHH55_02180 [Candidatus Delongbacteria bacterium]|nr:hypothetical protein [Candidatus Delongbacteria bacterium]